MFKRPTKNFFDGVQTLYEDNGANSAGYSAYPQRTERLENHPNIFETAKPAETRLLSQEEHPQWTTDQQEVAIIQENVFPEEPETTLGEGVSFKGELTFERLLRIDGNFEGILVSKGKIIVGPRGYVKANIDLEEAVIAGVVEGNITVTGKVSLQGNAMVTGDIQAGSLCVDEGVRLCGYVSIQGAVPSQQEEIDL
ncbi:polymer-forming cytoskeletal family protein [Chlamydia muridarum str. Nigg]|jgi:Integral membrane protein CcmA involved in cell shape determination|uniref:Polymer-forming cytoskeletal family protein n=2 Tax=Chlamydia muridarum TaxID=83560 RepID=A0A069ZXF6_CHLMR|nr:polymer-forming cytoskeletal protein [Chlamydia muridarum]UFW37690.1 polymer-forming cytoskeletal protein [Chlamydia trachomatis]AAF39387.1 conserved hypothetical protein [Chlamydia muridarum str. Nigg]AHH22937.1 hypothetical protein TAC_02890 [Chlamydia muridarum str. Nigg3 CMUT3-5]AHH23862.1 hypothetical protein Y015_02890 [Chlamydia muridarum str. Nigg CM972]AID38070.1 hypothetical protein BB17_02940 [Chlamydia muridarum str. Nigg 2 MCR]